MWSIVEYSRVPEDLGECVEASAIPAAPPTGSYGERAVQKMVNKATPILLSVGTAGHVSALGPDWLDSKAALGSNRCQTVFRQRTETDHPSEPVLNAKRRMF
jgi:hypothetical protein